MKFTFLILSLLFSTALIAQENSYSVKTFKTIADYKSDKGKDIGVMTNYTYANTPVGNTFKFIVNDEKVKTDEIWGFRAGDADFMMHNNLPLRIITVGDKYVYFEQGLMHLSLMIYGDATIYDNETIHYYALALDDKVYEHRKLKKFLKVCPAFQAVVDCFNGKAKTIKGKQARIECYRGCAIENNN